MLRSINLLYLRDDPEHFRELTEKEIRALMTWTDMKNDVKVDEQVELIRMGVYSLTPATYTIGLIPPGTFAKEKRESQNDIKEEVREGKRTKYSTDPQRNERLAANVRYKTSVLTSRMRPLVRKVGDEGKIGKKRHTGGKVAASKRPPMGRVVLERSSKR